MCRGVTSVFRRAMASAGDLTNLENLDKNPPGPIFPGFADRAVLKNMFRFEPFIRIRSRQGVFLFEVRSLNIS